MIDHRLAWTLLILGATVLAPGCGSESAYLDDADSLAAETSPWADSELGDGESAATDTDSDSNIDSDISSSAPGISALTCTTRITYGDAWLHPNHPAQFDDAGGTVTWDGNCTNEGPNSYAVLSNGWKPYFAGTNSCVMALDSTGCAGAPACTTRINYGSTWLPPANHPAKFDDVAGRVYWDRACVNSGAESYATLSNGWAPHFSGSNACAMSFSYTNCGGLYKNQVNSACADPGIIHDGTKYVAACTSGGAANAFQLLTSTDLVNWAGAGSIFPSAQKPSWAGGDYWAPEIHRVGNQYVAYYTARHVNGRLSVGAATGPTALGPFTDIGKPLVYDAGMGMIDATHFQDANGTHYLVWKADGNAVGQQTPIYGQALSASGTSLVGARTTLITNNLGWEGGVVEGPWVVFKNGYYYLFYSGNAFYNGTYAVGAARATSPLGPYTKAGAPILTTNSTWIGPGHCSVVNTPAGNSAMVYHAWLTGHVNGPGDARLMLVDSIAWGSNGWPSVPEGPSFTSRPIP